MQASELYEAERVQKIGSIMQRFSSAVRINDEVEFGLKGDTQFPDEYRSSRPRGRVIKVKNAGTDSASIRVKLTNGKTIDVPPHSIDSKRVWEFTDEHFPNVLARTQAESGVASAQYGRSTANSDYDRLIAKVDALSARLDDEINESRSFSGALVASFNEIAGEVQKVNPDSPFCKTFTTEYRGMMGPQGNQSKHASPFDSDFTDSDGDY